MGVPRVVGDEQLTNQYKLQISLLEEQKQNTRNNEILQDIDFQYQVINGIYNILKNPIQKKVYDKYLEHSSDVNASYLAPENTIMKIIQSGSTYMILMLGVLINSEKSDIKKSMKWVILSLILFLLIEIDMIVGDTDQADLFDSFFPQLTIAERGEILKILVLPIMLIIKNFFQYFFVNQEDKVSYILDQIPAYQRILFNEIQQAIAKANNNGQDREKILQIFGEYKQFLIQNMQKKEEEIIELNLQFAKNYEKYINNKNVIRQMKMRQGMLV